MSTTHSTSKPNESQKTLDRTGLVLTQSEIVVTVVLGGIFFSLIVTNIVFGIILNAEEKQKSRRKYRKESERHQDTETTPPTGSAWEVDTGHQSEGPQHSGHHRINASHSNTVPHSNETIRPTGKLSALQLVESNAARHDATPTIHRHYPSFESEEDLSNDSSDYSTNNRMANLEGIDLRCPVRLVTFTTHSIDVIPEEKEIVLSSSALDTASRGTVWNKTHGRDIIKQKVPKRVDNTKYMNSPNNKQESKQIHNHRPDITDMPNHEKRRPSSRSDEGNHSDNARFNYEKQRLSKETASIEVDNTSKDIDHTDTGEKINEPTQDEIELSVFPEKNRAVKTKLDTTKDERIEGNREENDTGASQLLVGSTHSEIHGHAKSDNKRNSLYEMEGGTFEDYVIKQGTEHNSTGLSVRVENTRQVTADVAYDLDTNNFDNPVNTRNKQNRSPVLDMSISDDAKYSYFTFKPPQRQDTKLIEIHQESESIATTMTEESAIIEHTQNRLSNSHGDGTSISSKRNHHIDENITSSEAPKRFHESSIDALMNTNPIQTLDHSQVKIQDTEFTHRLFHRPEKRKRKGFIKSSQSDNDIATGTAKQRRRDFVNGHETSRKISEEYTDDQDRYFTAYENESSGDQFFQNHPKSTRFNLRYNPSYYTIKSRLLASQVNTGVDPTTRFLHTSGGPVTSYPRPLALPAMTSLYTLSEEDLKTYPDTSIPTIDELVRRDAAKKRHKESKILRINTPTQKPRDASGVHQTEIVIDTEVDHSPLKYNRKDGHIIKKARYNINPPQNHRDEPNTVQNDLIGFHTGVSDRYHSISLQRESSLHRERLKSTIKSIKSDESSIHNNVNTLEGQNEMLAQTYASYSMAKQDSFPFHVAEQHQHYQSNGNWNLSILTPRSTGSRDAESVSSFALSDFDFGESDVDEMRDNENYDDANNDNKEGEYKTEDKNRVDAIKDVQL